MHTKKQRAILLLTLVFMITVVPIYGEATGIASTQPSGFPDLQDAWSRDAISWAVNKSIVGGYPDGTFKPRADVLEAEWTAMMFKYLEPGKKLDPPGSGHHWAENIYNHIAHYKLPIRGHQTVTARNVPLKRVEIAKITSALYGFNLSEAQAVEFMYDNDFSSGMGGGRYFHTYGADQNLQRQQAVMFLMKVDNQVKANGGVTYRGKFYAMASGPIGIPDGGLKFPNTTVDSIDWSRFNPVGQATSTLTQEDVTRLRAMRDSGNFSRNAGFQDFDEVPLKTKEIIIQWITKDHASHYEHKAILHPDTLYRTSNGDYMAIGFAQKTENGKTYEADAYFAAGSGPTGFSGGQMWVVSEWREVK